MPNLTIYLNKELFKYVEKHPSAIIQDALSEKIEKDLLKLSKSTTDC